MERNQQSSGRFRWITDRGVDVISYHFPCRRAQYFLRLENREFKAFTNIIQKEHFGQASSREVETGGFLMLNAELLEGFDASQMDDHSFHLFSGGRVILYNIPGTRLNTGLPMYP